MLWVLRLSTTYLGWASSYTVAPDPFTFTGPQVLEIQVLSPSSSLGDNPSSPWLLVTFPLNPTETFIFFLIMSMCLCPNRFMSVSAGTTGDQKRATDPTIWSYRWSCAVSSWERILTFCAGCSSASQLRSHGVTGVCPHTDTNRCFIFQASVFN